MFWIFIYNYSYIRYLYKYLTHRYPQTRYLENSNANILYGYLCFEYLHYLQISILILLLIDIQHIYIHIQFLLYSIFKSNILLDRYPNMDIQIWISTLFKDIWTQRKSNGYLIILAINIHVNILLIEIHNLDIYKRFWTYKKVYGYLSFEYLHYL